VQTLRAAADRSTRVRQQQEKLCRRWLTDAYGGRPVMKMAMNEMSAENASHLGGNVQHLDVLALLRHDADRKMVHQVTQRSHLGRIGFALNDNNSSHARLLFNVRI